MTRNSSKRSVVLLLLLALVLITPISASADTLNVRAVKQAKSNWCWAACAEMLGCYEEPGSTRSQWDVVMHVTGSTDNVPGSAEDAAVGAAFVCYNTSSFAATHRAFSKAAIKNMIDNTGNPLIVGIVWVDRDGYPVAGHMMVIAGYDDGQVMIIDPWDRSTRWMDYQDLLYFEGGYYLDTVCSNS